MKKFVICFLAVFFSCFPLFAIQIVVLDELDDMVKTSKINVLIGLDVGCAVYKKHLSFSVDNPHILLNNWKLKSEPQIEYIQSFRAEKEIFLKPFTVELWLKFLVNEKEKIKNELHKSFLHLSCLVLEQNGETKPKNFLVKLFDSTINQIDKKNQKPDTVKPWKMNKQINKKECDVVNDDKFLVEKRNCKSSFNSPHFILFISLLLFFLSLFCFLEKSEKIWSFTFFVGILLICFALPLFVTFLLLKNYWPFDSLC